MVASPSGACVGTNADDAVATLPLTAGQRSLWFLYQLAPGSASYNVKAAMRVRGLDEARLTRAAQRVVDRHDALRTTFTFDGAAPVQCVHRTMPVVHQRVDARGLDARAVAAAVHTHTDAPFDLERGAHRVTTFDVGGGEHVLAVVVHHLVTDGGAMAHLLDELLATYAALGAGREPILAPAGKLADVVAAERVWLAGPQAAKARTFWRAHLAGELPVLDLPTDRVRPPVQSLRGGTYDLTWDEVFTRRLRAFAQDEGSTVNRVLVTAYAILLARLAGQDEVVIGMTTTLRRRAAVARTQGYLVNPVALRVAVDREKPFRQLLAETGFATDLVLTHGDYPFPLLLDELRVVRDPSRPAIFQAYFGTIVVGAGEGIPPYMGPPRRTVHHGVELETFPCPQQEGQFDVSFMVIERDDLMSVMFQYDAAIFDDASARGWADAIHTLLEAAIADSGEAVGRLPLLDAAARARVVQSGPSTPPPATDTLRDRLLARFASDPDAIAIVDGDAVLSYADVAARAGGVAHALRTAADVGPEDLVAVFDTRGADLIVAIVGAALAGAPYLPVDPDYPPERTRGMLERGRARALVVGRGHEDAAAALITRLPAHARPVLVPIATIAPSTAPVPPRPLGPRGLAYALYTSGSSGQPKAVAIEHGGFMNHLDVLVDELGLGPRDVIAQTAPAMFDISVWQMLLPLTIGARVVVVADEVVRDAARLLDTFAAQGVTIAQLVPSLLRALLEGLGDGGGARRLPRLRWMSATGEALPPPLIPAWLDAFPDVPLLNAYGPAECSDDVTLLALRAPTTRANTPIGRPIRHLRVATLDPHLEPTGPGAVGELYVGGVGVGRGYLHDPARTAELFVPDPFGEPGARVYRSGDLARVLADGNLEYVGRIGRQIKLRGHRIELEEIQSCLAAHPSVADDVVIAREDVPGARRLVAYVVAAPGATVDAATLDAHVSAHLPRYMVPSAFVALDALPRTPNGKLDLRALPAPAAPRVAPSAPPTTPTETTLVELWRVLLGQPDLGIDDNFFARGGDSLFAIQIATRAAHAGLEVSVEQVYRHQRVRTLAAELDRARADAALAPAAEVIDPTRPFRLAYWQQTFWFLQQMTGRWSPFSSLLAIRWRGAIDGPRLRAAGARLLDRHQALRTVLGMETGAPTQRVDPTIGLAWEEVDAAGWSEERLQLALDELSARPFDLARGPVFRLHVLREAPDRAVIVLATTLIHADGWSLVTLLRDLWLAYHTPPGQEPTWPEGGARPRTFAHWVEREQRVLAGEAGQRLWDYWRTRLDGAPHDLRLATDRPRQAAKTASAGKEWIELGPALSQRLRAAAQAQRVSLFTIFVAAFDLVLHRVTGLDDLLLGTPVSIRPPGFEDVVGQCLNTIVLRSTLRGAPTLGAFVAATHETVQGALAHADYPFMVLVDKLKVARDPTKPRLLQVLVNQQKAQELSSSMGAAAGALSYVPLASTEVQFDMELVLLEVGELLTPRLEYNAAIFDAARIRALVAALRRELERLTDDPSAPARQPSSA